MEKTKYIKIKPFDTQFYGKRKSFVSSKDQEKTKTNFIASHDFPYPSTLYGALFSAFLALKKRQNKIGEKKRDIENYINGLIEDIEEYDGKLKRILNIRNIYLYDEKYKIIYLKAPLDIHYNSNKIGYTDKLLDYNLLYNLPEYKKVKNEFISMQEYYNYLKEGQAKLSSACSIISKKYRIGININQKRVAEDGKLYKTENYQFNSENLTYLIEYEDNNIFELKKKGFLLLGGQGKISKYEICNSQEQKTISILKDYFECDKIWFSDEIKEKNEVVKIIFHTDVYRDFIAEILKKFKNNHVIRGGDYKLGGYDYNKKEVKKLEKVFNAGTVIYIYNSKVQNVKKKLDEISNMVSYNTFKGFNRYKVYNITNKGVKNE